MTLFYVLPTYDVVELNEGTGDWKNNRFIGPCVFQSMRLHALIAADVGCKYRY